MAQDIKNADIAIIGTGPAGISAAITAKIRNKEIKNYINVSVVVDIECGNTNN